MLPEAAVKAGKRPFMQQLRLSAIFYISFILLPRPSNCFRAIEQSSGYMQVNKMQCCYGSFL